MIPGTPSTVLLVAVTTVTICVGSGIALMAHRAARRTDSDSLRLFSYGFGAISLGVAVSVVVALSTPLSTGEILLLQGVIVLFGYTLLVRSLYSGGSTSLHA